MRQCAVAVAGAPAGRAHEPEGMPLEPEAWLTLNARPAVVPVVDLSLLVLLATERLTVPLPVPLAPLVTESHEALAAAVQEQPAVVVTLTLKLPPDDVALWLVGEMA